MIEKLVHSDRIKRTNKRHALSIGKDTSGTSATGEADRVKPEVDRPIDFLRTVSEFHDLPDASLSMLAQLSRFATYDAGDYLVSEGDDENPFGFIIVTGRIAMLKSSSNGRELIVELLQQKDLFSLLLTLVADKLPAQISGRALQKTTVLWVSVNAFLSLSAKHPELMKEFTRHLLLCLQSAYCLSRGLAHDQVRVRIASLLTSLSLKFKERDTPANVIELHFTRQQLADLAGTTPETAIRVTRAMEKDKLLGLGRSGIIKVLDLEGLIEIVEE